MGITANNQPELISWAKSKIGFGFREDAKAVARITDGTIRAVVVYDNFTDCDCSMHIASDGSGTWLTRELLLEAFYYPFVTCDKRRVTGLVPASNDAALRFDQRIGFKYEGLMRKALPADDLVILGMLRSDCLFIAKEYRRD